ncbi:hypothetical protein ES703_84710 [subsurface metagenome]
MALPEARAKILVVKFHPLLFGHYFPDLAQQLVLLIGADEELIERCRILQDQDGKGAPFCAGSARKGAFCALHSAGPKGGLISFR